MMARDKEREAAAARVAEKRAARVRAAKADEVFEAAREAVKEWRAGTLYSSVGFAQAMGRLAKLVE
jgi:hypothetical protein